MRVASFGSSEAMLSAALRVQAQLSGLQLQAASGRKAQTDGALGTSARKLISLEMSHARAKAYETSAKEALGRVEIMHDALGSMSDLLTQFRARLAAEIGANHNDSSAQGLATAAKDFLAEFATFLNLQHEGRHLFAGTATQAAPVDLSGFAAADLSTADDSYYQGNNVDVAVRVSAEQTLSYGITADADAFEKAVRALSYIANAGATASQADLQQASDLIVASIDGIAAMQGKMSVTAGALQRAVDRNVEYQDFLAAGSSDIAGVDVAEVTARMMQYETQLQASYAALGKLQKLSLVDYLR